VYHGFDSDVSDHVTVNDNNKIEDIVFSGSLTTGNNFHQERIRLIEEILQSDIDMKLYANLEKRSRIIAKQLFYYTNSFFNLAGLSGFADRIKILEHGKSKIQKYSGKLLRQTLPPVYGSNMYNLFRNSKIVLNYHIGVAGNYAGNMRMFEVTGMGSCLLTDNKKNINDLFSPGNEVVVYDNPDDCISKVKWLLEHEDERQKIARAGQEKTLKNHTVEKRCESIIQIIQDQLNKV
jgi:spore maturation protein CgeB